MKATVRYMIAVEERKRANFDVVNSVVDRLLAQLPDADMIEVSVYKYRSDDE